MEREPCPWVNEIMRFITLAPTTQASTGEAIFYFLGVLTKVIVNFRWTKAHKQVVPLEINALYY